MSSKNDLQNFTNYVQQEESQSNYYSFAIIPLRLAVLCTPLYKRTNLFKILEENTFHFLKLDPIFDILKSGNRLPEVSIVNKFVHSLTFYVFPDEK